MYRKALLRLSGNQNKPNRAERFVAGAMAGQPSNHVACMHALILTPTVESSSGSCGLLACASDSQLEPAHV